MIKSPRFWLSLIGRSVALHLHAWVWSDRTANRAILFEINYLLARKVAHRWENSTNEPYKDLEQIASIGLLKAIERFNPRLGFRFSSYAFPRINGEIHHYIRDKSRSIRIPRKIAKMKSDIQSTREKLIKKNRHLTDREIAIGLNYTDEDLADLHALSNIKVFDSVDNALDVEYRPTTSNEEYRDIRSLIIRLPAKNRKAIEDRFFRGQFVENDCLLCEQSIEILRGWMTHGE